MTRLISSGRSLMLFTVATRPLAGRLKKFMRPRKDDKAQLLAEKIQRGRTQSGSGQTLLHGGKAGIGRAGGKKLHVLVRIETKMFDDQPCRRFKGAAKTVDPNGLAFKLLDRFQLG